MPFKQDYQDFQILQPFYMTAIQSKSSTTKQYTLSVDFQGVRIDVMQSKAKIKFAGFSEVIQGAVLRLKKLFNHQPLDLKVLVHQKPSRDNVSLAAEILCESSIEIAGEAYYLSVMLEYSYDTPEEVTYYPILYREVCANGMFAKLSRSFKETIPVSEIYDIKCDWSICNFEDYCAAYGEVIQDYRADEFESENEFHETARMMFNNILEIDITDSRAGNLDVYIKALPENDNASELLDKYRDDLGINRFAILNALTEYASRQNDYVIRNEMFIKIGNYVSNNIEKKLKEQNQNLTKTLFWDDLLDFITK